MKFAQVGYGSTGEGVDRQTGEAYTYLVEDNVRVGTRLTPIVKHAKSGEMFVTTGVVLEESKDEYDLVGASGYITQDELTRAYTSRQLGVYGSRGKGGKFMKETSYTDENGEYVLSKEEQDARALSLAVYEKEQRDKGLKPTYSGGRATTKALDTLDELTESQKIGKLGEKK